MSSGDAWDVSQGTVVTDNSPVLYAGPSWFSDIRDMFGGEYSGVERNRTLFDDAFAGQVHWVEWQTPEPVLVNAYNLVATADGASTNVRVFNRFKLFAWSGVAWVMLDDVPVTIPYGGGPNYVQAYNLELEGVFPMTTAQRFRAEFVQHGDANQWGYGPRINELDGFFSIPEPSSVLGVLVIMLVSAARRPSLAGQSKRGVGPLP